MVYRRFPVELREFFGIHDQIEARKKIRTDMFHLRLQSKPKEEQKEYVLYKVRKD